MTRSAAARAPAARLVPPLDGVVVRMYRIGHGDCFLLAFPGGGKPTYVLIDCGYKPGSPKFIHTTAKDVCANIRDATGGHIDVAVITHEHQDHVNGITEANFKDITIGETWFAWTEDPEDDFANQLRDRFKDRLALLLTARDQLAIDGRAAQKVARIDDFLAFEFGGDQEDFSPEAATALLGADGGIENSQNKRAMKLFRKRAANGVRYLQPHGKAIALGDTAVRIYPLGPPRDLELLHSLDPEDDESFRDARGGNAFGVAAADRYLAAAIADRAAATAGAPFPDRRVRTPLKNALATGDHQIFWQRFYGGDGIAPYWSDNPPHGADEAPANAAWRRIDQDWLYSAEQLALDMNNDTNNGSLVLAFELTPGGKVLLFAADAQRGNWRSWTNGDWQDGDRKVTIKDLLGRTVLYKVGHHGSHNATLHGELTSDYANLDWMAQGDAAVEFTAMITAVRPWAETQKGWDHPQKAIKDALLHKSGGRLFQTDTDLNLLKPAGSTAAEWQAFMARINGGTLYFDYTVKF